MKEEKAFLIFRLIFSFPAIVILIIGLITSIIDKNSGLIIDATIFLILVIFLIIFSNKMHQTRFSYLFFMIAIIMHSLYFYGAYFFGIPFEYIMHVFGSFAVALGVDRFYNVNLPIIHRVFLVVLITVGIGAILEIFEWLGYAYLGEGDGIFMYGFGDYGAWQNSIVDMLFNFIGAIFSLFFIKWKN